MLKMPRVWLESIFARVDVARIRSVTQLLKVLRHNRHGDEQLGVLGC